MDSTTFEVSTRHTFTCVELTGRVAEWVRDRGDGLCHVFVPHATAGVALFETGSGSEDDVETTVGRLLPRDEGLWRHAHGSPGHGADHVLPLLVSPSLVVPVLAGRLALGTWQSIVLVDPNVDNRNRTVRLSFVAA